MTETEFNIITSTGTITTQPLCRFCKIVGNNRVFYCVEIAENEHGNRKIVSLRDEFDTVTLQVPYDTFKQMLNLDLIVCMNYTISKNGHLIVRKPSHLKGKALKSVK